MVNAIDHRKRYRYQHSPHRADVPYFVTIFTEETECGYGNENIPHDVSERVFLVLG